MNEQLIKLGQIAKLHGYKGSMVFRLSSMHTSIISDFNWVFVNMHGEDVPWKVESYKILDTANILVKLDEINDDIAVKRFLNLEFSLPSKSIKLPELTELPVDSIKGWKVMVNDNELGIINEIIENKFQMLLSVATIKGDVFIPLVQEFIEDVNSETKSIQMALPEGLLDL